MTSIKVKFRPSMVEGREGVIYYQIIHRRMIRQLSTEYRIFADEWDERRECIVLSNFDSDYEHRLSAIYESIELDRGRFREVIAILYDRNQYFTVDDIVQDFYRLKSGLTLFTFIREIIDRLRALQKERSVETYTTTLNSFTRFREGEDMLLTDLTSDIFISYESYLKTKVNLTMNTVSFYMRILRAIYNRAVERGLIRQKYPFKYVYTGVDKTIKRALSLKSIRQIKEADLSECSKMEFARDMFLFSFYTRGMSFVDMAYLGKRDLSNGVLTYRRRKTGQTLCIKWERCMQEIVDKYPLSESKYLLPIIPSECVDCRQQYRKILVRVNTYLKKISTVLSLQMLITMYCARHSWASIAKSQNIPLSVISEGMGHDSETTTQIYLASLDTAVVDRANSLILKLLK